MEKHNKYIVLLRGINVSGQKKIKMDKLKTLLDDFGFSNVLTYIQSGNLILSSELSKSKTVHQIHKLIKEYYDFHVEVFVFEEKEWINIISKNPFDPELKTGALNSKKMYFTFYKRGQNYNEYSTHTHYNFNNELIYLNEEVIYVYAAHGYGKTKFSNNHFEKKLDTIATTRNLTTVLKLKDLISWDG